MGLYSLLRKEISEAAHEFASRKSAKPVEASSEFWKSQADLAGVGSGKELLLMRSHSLTWQPQNANRYSSILKSLWWN